jgi:hypothetical protein
MMSLLNAAFAAVGERESGCQAEHGIHALGRHRTTISFAMHARKRRGICEYSRRRVIGRRRVEKLLKSLVLGRRRLHIEGMDFFTKWCGDRAAKFPEYVIVHSSEITLVMEKQAQEDYKPDNSEAVHIFFIDPRLDTPENRAAIQSKAFEWPRV